MATKSLSINGQLGEQTDELREIVNSGAKLTADSLRMKRIALGTLEAIDGQPADTVHLSVNPSEGAGGTRTYTVTVTLNPAPAT